MRRRQSAALAGNAPPSPVVHAPTTQSSRALGKHPRLGDTWRAGPHPARPGAQPDPSWPALRSSPGASSLGAEHVGPLVTWLDADGRC